MGFLSKSFLILLVAIASPLAYRHFATEDTIKFMSSYYGNFKSIDQFLRQSAQHIDQAKDYLPDQVQLRNIYGQVNQQIKTFVADTKAKVSEKVAQYNQDAKKTDGSKKETKSTPKEVPKRKIVKCDSEKRGDREMRLWSKSELSLHDGNSQDSKVYLAFLGLVYDVSSNAHHYAKGSDYNAFAGKDATRAFVTGNFTHDLHDDIRDLDEASYSQIETWATFYKDNYPFQGRLEGQFYDSNGCGTPELKRVHKMIDNSHKVKEKSQEQVKKIPECNSEWNGETKQGKVWCSNKSGGIERSWVGVPRIYEDGESSRCVCYNVDDPDAGKLAHKMSAYPGCKSEATECILKK